MIRSRITRAFAAIGTTAILAVATAGLTTPALAAPVDPVQGWSTLELKSWSALPKTVKPGTDLKQYAAQSAEATKRNANSDDPANPAANPTPMPVDTRPGARQFAPNYDYYTLDTCRALQGDNIDFQKYKNHFAYCYVGTGSITDWGRDKDGNVITLGVDTFRLTITGEGITGDQKMKFWAAVDKWTSHPGAWNDYRFQLDIFCFALPRANCQPNSRWESHPRKEWKSTYNNKPLTWTFDTSKATGGGDGKHNDKDAVSYYEASPSINLPDGLRPTNRNGYKVPFRCDRASYVYVGGGSTKKPYGCIYHEVPATFALSRTAHANISEVIQHIEDAQTGQGSKTKPPAVGVIIPGGKKSGQQLSRNYYQTHDVAGNGSLEDKSRAQVVRICSDPQYYTQPYTTGPNGEARDCDEYPMAATYQNAATIGSTGRWYSARPLNRSQNRSAGNAYKNWMRDDHILDSDWFWVRIDP
ncbi:hypothetical protein E1287_20535 [Actinomadura sp. KC06]|uniref:hypothetical protein n=1 Tax=Actinomadura sp. KC06 TaxID=2530369 RepID=UPI00104DD1E6|nr:hypothetical protein [Actinomadura sp. KC06]TDD33089.1 hypothetical protein E1287_20535 [Actinomadura sp. KC06]